MLFCEYRVLHCHMGADTKCKNIAMFLTYFLLQNTDEAGCDGNVFLDRMLGAHMYLAPMVAPYLTHLKPRMDMIADNIKYADSYPK